MSKIIPVPHQCPLHGNEWFDSGCRGCLWSRMSLYADVAGWLLEALNSATTRDEFDFLVLGAPRELLSVMRSLDPDGLIPDVSSPASSVAGGGSGPSPVAPASGDVDAWLAHDVPAAGPSLVSRVRYADQLRGHQ